MILIKNGYIKPIDGEDIENGQVLVENGKIAAIGKNVKAPADAEVIDAKGMIVSPGFVDAHSHVGLHEEGVGREGSDVNEIGDPVSPQIRGRDGINPRDPAIEEGMIAGVTTSVVGPGSGNSIGGTFVAMKMNGNNVDDMIFKDPVAMKCAFGENPKRVYGDANKLPRTRMGNVQNIRECIIKAKEYRELLKIAQKDPSKAPKHDAKLEAMQPVINKEIPLKAHCHRADDIYAAISLAKEMDVNMTLDHCTEGYLIADEIAASGINAIIGPTFLAKSKVELQNNSFKNYARMYEAGVKFAIMSDHAGSPVYYLPLYAGLAVREGLPEKEAWKAITLNAAEITGIADKVGSLTVGKDADIAIFDGNPVTRMDYQTALVMIDGKITYKNENYNM